MCLRCYNVVYNYKNHYCMSSDSLCYDITHNYCTQCNKKSVTVSEKLTKSNLSSTNTYIPIFYMSIYTIINWYIINFYYHDTKNTISISQVLHCIFVYVLCCILYVKDISCVFRKIYYGWKRSINDQVVILHIPYILISLSSFVVIQGLLI